jgi:hypothetical protein
MPRVPFPHDGPIRIVADDNFEVAYYALGWQKYKRIRQLGIQTWQETIPQEITRDEFWMVAACIERKALA